MNSNYEETLDKNFERACELCSNSYSYEELMEFLKHGNIPEKQFASLEISELKTKEDAKIFLSNLINCDGKIREAVAQKFLEFSLKPEYREYFSVYPQILAQSTIDINANISRMVIDGLALMNGFEKFGKEYSNCLIQYIKEAFDGLDKIVFRDKKYTINKQMFKLYWCLEGLNKYYFYVEPSILKEIIEKSIVQTEYTVREKVAQLLLNKEGEYQFDELIKKIKTDENYYVKNLV